MEAALNVFIALCCLMMVRNMLVYRIRMRRLKEVNAESQRRIDAGTGDWYAPWREHKQGATYEAQLFDLTKWTYRHFYPNEE